jgi:hypothetical protein
MTGPGQTGITDQTSSRMRSMRDVVQDLGAVTGWSAEIGRINRAAVPDPSDLSGQEYLQGIADATSRIFDVIGDANNLVTGSQEGGEQAVRGLENADDEGRHLVTDFKGPLL